MPYPSHPPWLHHSIILGKEYKLWRCKFLQPPITWSLSGPNILLGTLFSNTLSLCSSPNVRDKVSHPYKTTGKNILLYFIICIFLNSRREDKRYWIELKRALPEFNLLLISSWIKFWFVCCCSQIFELCHSFKGCVSYLYVMILGVSDLRMGFGLMTWFTAHLYNLLLHFTYHFMTHYVFSS
jgi:hypothetical protein